MLPAEQLDGLYDNPWTCRALLRALLPLARLYAMRLLLTSEGVPRGVFAKSFVCLCASAYSAAYFADSTSERNTKPHGLPFYASLWWHLYVSSTEVQCSHCAGYEWNRLGSMGMSVLYPAKWSHSPDAYFVP